MANTVINIDIDARRAQKSTNDLDKSVGNFNKTTTTARSQLRNMMTELQGLEIGSDRFNQLSREAAVLRDQIDKTNATVKALSDDFFLLKGATDVISGIGGAFNVATGAMALFGAENEELEAAMQKVVLVMGITNGLQQVSNLLRKESSAMIFLQQIRTAALNVVELVRNRILTTQNALTRQATILQGQNTIATNAAAVATRGLGIAMNALPIMAVLTGIGLLIGAFVSMSKSVDDVNDSVDGMKDSLTNVNSELDFNLKAQERYSKRIELLMKQNDLAVKQGTKTREQALKEEIKLLEQREKALDTQIAQRIEDSESIKFLMEQNLDIPELLEGLDEDLQNSLEQLTQVRIEIENRRIKIEEDREKRIDEIRSKNRKDLQDELELERIYFNRREDLRQKDLESMTKWQEEIIERLERQNKFIEGYSLIGPGGIVETDISEVLGASYIDGVYREFRNMVAIIRIDEKEYQKLVKEGTDLINQSYNERIDLLEKERDVKLKEAKTDGERQIIQEQHFNNLTKLENEQLSRKNDFIIAIEKEKRVYEELKHIYNILQSEVTFGDRNLQHLVELDIIRKQLQVDALQTDQDINRKRFNDFKKTEDEKLALEKEILEESQRMREREASAESEMRIQDSIKNLEQQYTLEERQTLLYEQIISSIKRNEAEKLETDLAVIRGEARDKELKLEQQHVQKLKQHREPIQEWLDDYMQAIDEVMFSMYNALNAFSDAVRVNTENASIEREQRFSEETSSLESQLTQQLVDREEYDARLRAIQLQKEREELAARRKQFMSEKRTNIGRAIMDGAGAILRAIQQFGPPPSPLGILGMASATGITAAQIATISGQQFKASRGGVVPGNQRPNTDSVSALLAPGETVINSKASRLFPQLLSTINQIGGGVPLAPEPTNSKSFNDNRSIKVNIGIDEITNVQSRLSRYQELNEF